MERVSVYIDGFNLYFGLCSKGWHRYLWLDVGKLANVLLNQNQILIGAKYFTALVRDDPAKEKRQSTYLQALEEVGNVSIFLGRYQAKTKTCKICKSSWREYEEKMSDVRIASELLRDAFLNRFDTAILVSADGDLQPPIDIIKEEFPKKKLVIAFPPERDNPHLKNIVNSYFRIGRGRISKCQLPLKITKPNGYVLKKPKEWN